MALRQIKGTSIADDAVTTDKVLDRNITAVKVAEASLGGFEIQSGAIAGADIASTFDISSKTVTLPAASVTAHVTTATPANVSDTANTSTGYFDVPAGTTGQRPGSPALGNMRFNSTTEGMEVYNGTGWVGFALSNPTVSSISPTTAAATGTTITITGTNFVSGTAVKVIGADNTQYTPGSTTFVSTTELSITTPVLPVANEPYDIKVTVPSGGTTTLVDSLDAGGVPTWTTAAGSLGNIFNGSSGTLFTLVAGDPDSQTIAYAETTSILSGVGLTLNSSTGVISGDPNDVGSSTTYNFTVSASDGVNTTNRAFSFGLHTNPTGGTETTATISGQSYRIHTFTSGGVFTTPIDVEVDVLVVAGGGSGGNRHGGGGGAGGLIHVVGSTIGAGSYTSTIGSGAGRKTGTGAGTEGSNTTFVGTGSVSLTTIGGGGGASYGATTGRNGGSGGGAGPYWENSNSGLSTATQSATPSMTGFTGGAGTGYGNRGGGNPGNHAVGGGGGAGAVGGNALDMGGGESSDQGGVGGAGLQINIDGNDYYWAGGGGGGGRRAYHAGAGGAGGGGGGGSEGLHSGTHGVGDDSGINDGADGWHESNGGDAGANTGGGGGGQSQTGTEGYSTATVSGAGGSGIVIVRYRG